MRQDFEVNFFGLVDMTQASLPLLKKVPEGRIINISSMMGSHAAALDLNSEVFGASATGYQDSKSAANMFTIQLAKELEQSHVNISVNAVDPGIVATNFGGTPAQQSAARGLNCQKLASHEQLNLLLPTMLPPQVSPIQMGLYLGNNQFIYHKFCMYIIYEKYG